MAIIFILCLFCPVYAAEQEPEVIPDITLAKLTDNGGVLLILPEWVTIKLKTGEIIYGSKIKYIYDFSPIENSWVKYDDIIWAIDDHFFLQPEDFIKYVKSISPNRKFKLLVKKMGKDTYSIGEFLMPPGARVQGENLKVLKVQIDRLLCQAKIDLAKATREKTPTFCDNDKRTLKQLIELEVELYRRIITSPGKDYPEIRFNAAKELKDLGYEK
jgi:hypothetical protein